MDTLIQWDNLRTFSHKDYVRIEAHDLVKGNFFIVLQGNDSLRLGVDLIRAYFAHCFYWFREKFTPFSSK